MKKIAILSVLGFFPVFAFAATKPSFQSILGDIGDIIKLVTPIVVALALVYFFYGLAKYILSAGDEEKKGEGRNIMIWGIIALFVIISVWGLTKVIINTFGINENTTITVPVVL